MNGRLRVRQQNRHLPTGGRQMRGMVTGLRASVTFAPARALSLIVILQLHQALPPYQRHLRVLSEYQNWPFVGQEQGFLSDPMRAGLAWQPTALHHAPVARHPAMHHEGNKGNTGNKGKNRNDHQHGCRCADALYAHRVSTGGR
jgi:hypothetical protein